MSLNFLTKDKGYIFRITHVENLPWILDNGLHCQSSGVRDDNFVPIGNPGLISKRNSREVEAPTGGTLSDYVPFYFTPRSIMLCNILSGRGKSQGVNKREPDDIVMMATRLPTVDDAKHPFAFTNAHAYSAIAETYTDLGDLCHIDWPLLQQADFRRDPEDPDKTSRYQAEALVHKHLPVDCIQGFYAGTEATAERVGSLLDKAGIQADTGVKQKWFFQ